MSGSTRIAVLGGGIAGCICARELSEIPGVSVDLYERSDRLGGLHRSIEIDGTTFDIGAFVFHPTSPLFDAFPFLRELFIDAECQSSAVTPHGTIDRYPPTPQGFLRDNSPARIALTALDLIYSKFRWRRRDTLPAFLRYYLGSTGCRDSGLRDYLERFYTLPEDEIDLELALQRFSSIVDSASIRRNLVRALRRTWKHRASGGYHCLVRPRGGFRGVYDAIASDLESRGVRILTNVAITSIRRRSGRHVIGTDGGSALYDRVISTLPIATMPRLLGLDQLAEEAETEIGHVTLISLFYRFRGVIAFPGQSLYNFTSEPSWKRLTVQSRFYERDADDHYFTVECMRAPWTGGTVRSAAEAFEAHLPAVAAFKGKAELVGGCVTERAYPIFRRGYKERLRTINEAVSGFGIEMAGRQGTFRHLSTHETVASARAAAVRVISSVQGSHGARDDDPRHGSNGTPRVPTGYLRARRIIDFLIAFVALPAAIPFMILTAASIQVISPGPVLFRQRRVGYQGREFIMVKLRTMACDGREPSDGSEVMTEPDDTRVDRLSGWIRRHRLDELPQLIHVLSGDMALIGPRPMPAGTFRRIEKELPAYGARQAVRPGLTGLAQIELGYTNSIHGEQEKLEYDLAYIEGISPTLDLRILAATFVTVVRGEGGR